MPREIEVVLEGGRGDFGPPFHAHSAIAIGLDQLAEQIVQQVPLVPPRGPLIRKSVRVVGVADDERTQIAFLDPLVRAERMIVAKEAVVRFVDERQMFVAAPGDDELVRVEERDEQVVITNTIPLHSDRARSCTKIKQLSVARLLGQAIRSINEETSVSSLFV